jgi:hypothetical protein
MRYSLFILILALPSLTYSQVKQSWLNTKIAKSDSVFLVSHQEREGSDEIMLDSAGNEIPFPKLIAGGKLNYQIIKEKTILTGKQIDTLIQILSRPFQDKMITEGKCFEPHHTIFLIKNNTISFIDICFSCRQFETSTDLARIPVFDNRRWRELKAFFLRHGHRYKLMFKKK